jgi:oligopeptide transport system substrate-binding protein
LRIDAHNHRAPGVAEKWEITKDGATFWLRPDAKWSDGKPVTAHDFVFAWRRTVDPKSASEYANIMSGIRNAEAITAGKLPPTALGVQAVNDRELRVEFEHPIPYFAQLMAFNVFYPIRQDFFESTHGRYASSADTLLYNGPFKMTLWVHGAHIRMEKNPYYWDRKRIQVNVLDFPYITTDSSAIMNLFRDGKIALAGLAEENLQEAQLLRWNIKSFNDGSVFYVEFNHRPGHITRNLYFRKAIQYTLSSTEEVNKVIKIPGYLPGKSLFPSYLNGVHGKFRQEYPVEQVTPDPVKARHYLELAKKQLGLKKFPPIMLLCGDVDLANRIAEYYQSTLKRQLGLDIKIDKQTFKQRLAKTLAGDFDMVLGGWGPDYSDPLTFGDLFDSQNVNNRGRYNNPALDAQVEIARNSNDPATRMQAFAKIQKIVVDQAVILPEYERTRLFVVSPAITGVVRRAVGPDPDFTNVRIVGK